MNRTRPIYQLGRAKFSVTHADAGFEQVLGRLLPLTEADPVERDQIIDVQMGLSLNINEFLRQLINEHHESLLLQAACMVSEDGGTVLISGAQNSGKTTLALALAMGHGWKVLAEDATIINATKNEITSFAAPFNLKPGARTLLGAAGIDIPGFILREWYPIETESLAQSRQANFALCVHLDGEMTKPLVCSSKTISEHLRKILPISNLLSVRGTEQFLQYLPEKSCYLITGGDLRQRIEKLIELSTASN